MIKDPGSLDPDGPVPSGTFLAAYAARVSEVFTAWNPPGSESTRAGSDEKASRRPPPPLGAGSEVNGRYRIEAVLGAGGMGRVYRVRDSLYSDRPTALKTVLTSVDVKTAALFQIEFQTMASLGHPGIARVYDFERMAGNDDEFFFTMELLDGRDIAQVTDRRDWKRIAARLAQVARALDYMHRHGVIHLDVKPSNVLLSTDADGDERVKVLDFGLAGIKETQGIFGTLMYIAPEVARGQVPDGRADIYALGVMAFELLCGRPPYDATSNPETLFDHKVHRPIAFPSDVEAGPTWLLDAVERMCAIDPAGRPRHAIDVARLLEESLDLGGSKTVLPTVSMSRFVGRVRELDLIVDHVRSCVDRTARVDATWLFVSGTSGVGKSRLVGEARHQLQVAGILFINGDSFPNDLAEYTPIVPVMLAAASLARANAAADLIAAYGPEIVKMAPGFGAAQGVIASPALEYAPAERRRILRATADFLLGLASRVGFVVTFNDLQWAPRGSIEVLVMLLDRRDAFPEARLAVVGTYRVEGVSGTPFEDLLHICDSRGACRHVRLDHLDAAGSKSIVQSMLGHGVSVELIEHLHAATGGEPLLLEQAVRNAVASGAIVSRHGTLVWASSRDPEPSRLMAAHEAVHSGLSRLGPVDRTLIELMAACRRPVSPEVLARAAAMALDTVQRRLRSLEEQQIVVLLPGKDSKYGLSHDRIREAAYAAGEDAAQRQERHERLADAYAATLSPDDAGEHLLATVAQFIASGAPVDDEAGAARAVVAVRAARAAHNATAFSQALRYLDAAAGWLPEQKWDRCRDVALDLEEQRAYACIAEERLDEAEASGLRVEQYAIDAVRRARGRRAWITCQIQKGHLGVVIESGIDLVRRLGGPLPRRPKSLHTLLAITRLRRMFTPAVVRRIETLPRMTDPRAIEIDKCLEALYLGAYLVQPTLLPVVAEAASRLILENGLAPSSSVTLLTAGHILAAVGDLTGQMAISDVAIKLLPHTNRSSYGMARYSYAGVISPRRDLFCAVSNEMMAIRAECLEVGDNIFAGMACMSRIALDIEGGAPLGTIETFMQDPATRHLLDASTVTRKMQSAVRQAIYHLRTGVDGPVFEGPYSHASQGMDRQGLSERAYYRLIVEASYRLPLSRAVRSAIVPLTIERIWPGTPFVPETFFSWALCQLNACRAEPRSWLRQPRHYTIGLMRRRLGKWAARYPPNYKHRATLLDAEWLRYRGQVPAAVAVYAQAIQEADEARDLRCGGLARELGAEACLELGERDRARSYVEAARACYERWNADGKVRDVERRYADLLR